MNDNDNTSTPEKRDFKSPVGWLAGRELLAALKRIAAYTFMGDKLDPKDWMIAKTISPPHKNKGTKDAFWFDFIADTGDGMQAVYTIACLSMSELWLGETNEPGSERVSLKKEASFQQILPRGEFLFIGGDTAYHIADTASLMERFQTPFNWAFDDLNRPGAKVERRPIYGIPANHDYYDALDGFNRQFLKPLTQEPSEAGANEESQPQLSLKGFIRNQTASYVALKLPFDWYLWGFDAQQGKMDKRQQAFFTSTFHEQLLKQSDFFDGNHYEALKPHVPKKLIVATPEPTTVFGKWAGKDSDIVETFTRLGLEPSFLEKNNGSLDRSQCRLDISGDIHHYERYWGSAPGDAEPVNYASIVAGGGGAFLHPSHTDLDEVERIRQYPSREDSHKLITREVLNPWNIFRGGYLWLVGAIAALLTYFAVTIPESTWALFKLIPDELRPSPSDGGILSRIQKELDISIIVQAESCCSDAYYVDLIYILSFSVFLLYWAFKASTYFDSVILSEQWRQKVWSFVLPVIGGALPLFPLILWPRSQLPASFLAGILIDGFVIAALLLFSLSRCYSDVLIARAKRRRETLFDRFPLWLFGLLGAVYAGFGFLRYGAYPSSVTTFDLLTALVWLLLGPGLVGLAVFAGGALFLSQYKKRLSELARFAALGVWHAILQLSLPLCLVLYSDWITIAMVSASAYAITVLAGRLFASNFLVNDFSLKAQQKIGHLLLSAWVVLGVGLLLAACSGDPVPVTGLRLSMAPILGALFSCIWFGWYLAVSIAYHGHNNEAGGGARSEQFRHLIRFKLTEDALTAYVIGADRPVADITSSEAAKFRLVDVFTIKVKPSDNRT